MHILCGCGRGRIGQRRDGEGKQADDDLLALGGAAERKKNSTLTQNLLQTKNKGAFSGSGASPGQQQQHGDAMPQFLRRR